ncbi:MAG: PAS domain S-box protein [Lentimicrobium sp.]|nr:PAS domain S-box protein [Lentimicrobium sp.]
MSKKDPMMNELIQLRKRIAELEQNDGLFKETEKKLHAANQQLQESGLQLISRQDTLIRTQKIARVGSWEWYVATDTVTWSDELFRIFGMKPENGAVSYADHPKIYVPDSMQRLDAAVQRALKSGEPFEIDLEIIRTDGTNAFCTARGYAEKDEKGKVVRLFGSFQDITERKNAEEELKKSEERLRTVIDNSPFPIAVVDIKDNHIQYWSKSAIQLFGHYPKTTEEWYKLAFPNKEYRQEAIERWKPFLEIAQNTTDAVNTGEYEIHCKNGSVKICEIYAQFIPGSLIITLNDITERKNTEKHLKTIEWLLQNKKKKTEIKIPDYGDLTAINQNRTILDSVGKEVLNGIVSDYLSLLETSAAVYEKNGDYAVGIFSSDWCRFMDCSARALCKTKNNKNALESGKWLCHESCWADASKQSIQTNKPVDIECNGGLHIFAIPIRANNQVIGSINFGYGNPPTDKDQLIEIAARYNVSVDKLEELAKSYETRPAFIIDIAKEKLETSAKLIGNIVELKQLEKDLQKNQKRYKEAQALGHVGNWEYDPISANFWASDEAKRIYGYDLNLNDFSTEMVERCIPERKRVHQALLDLVEHNKKYELVFDIITNDKGIRKTIHSIADIERDAQGNPLKITGVIIDITVQKNAEDNLKALNQQLIANEQQLRAVNQQLQANEQQLQAANQQLFASEQQLLAANQQLRAANQQLLEAKGKAEKSEERFNLAMNASSDGLFDWNLETNEIYYSPGWKKMIGYEDHEIPNDFSVWEKTTAPEDVKKSWELHHKLITKQLDRFVIEFKMKHKLGHWVDILSRAEAIFDEEGKAIRMVGTHVDISERKKIELDLIAAKEKAQESEEKYKALYENAPLSYQSLNEDGSFNDVNPAWLATLGYKREEVIGKFYKDFLHPGWQSHFEKNFPVFKKLGYISDVQFKLRHKKGHYLDISFEGCIGYHPDGSFKQTYCVFQDITEKKQALEELVIAKEKAEEADRLKSAFLANMSHEIRTPMNGILGFSNLLKEPQLTGDQQQKYINIIERSGTRMLNIINDIIDISKIEAGLMNLNISNTDIKEKIEFIYIFFKPQVEEKGMQFIFKNTLSAKEATIRTDSEKLYSILTNLVKNAIKYSNKGTIEFGCLKKGETLEFYVKDTGIGIPKDRQSAIFERFIQADITDKMARQGAGLGLAISKAYVEMLGGKIWLDSEEGIGTTFYFTLPYNANPEENRFIENSVRSTEEKMLINPEVSGKRILIVEDDEISEKLISIIVKDYCQELLVASTGNEAVKICQTNPDLDLILMDIQLPDLNGHEATRQIRQFNKNVKIIAQTAFGLSGDHEKAIEAGCNDYISKPIKKEELVTLIQKYFRT